MKNHKNRCLQLSKYYPPIYGGIETTTKDICNALYKNDWHVEVYCSNMSILSKHSFDLFRVNRFGSFIKLWNIPLSPGLFFRLLKERNSFDIIHVHLPNPFLALCIWLVRPSSKVVLHWHSDIVNHPLKLMLFRPLQSWIVRRANLIFCTSINYANSSMPLKQYLHKVKILPSPVAEPLATNATFDIDKLKFLQEPIFKKKKIVFSLGRLVAYKGFEDLIDASVFLDDDIIILIGGDGPLKQKLENIIIKRDLVKRVFIMGRLSPEESSTLFKKCDLFCLPSKYRSEAFGLVMVEAMAYSKPVVATFIEGSGVSWVNIHKTTGLNSAPGDIKGLARNINQIIGTPGLAKKMGEAGRRRFEDLFTIPKMTDVLCKEYNSLA